jgi:hypothetical protein
MSTPSPSPLLADALPQFAHGLEELLKEQNESGLAAQVPGLRIVDRCRCGDDFCTTFYTQAIPKGSYGPDHRNLELRPDKGWLILDIMGVKIVCVEVLYREEIRRELHAVLP